MSGDNHSPDVVVVGMPSCGKTVFFTVLGKKFTCLVEGRSAAPLGFRLSTCDESTGRVVDAAYDRLCSGLWPKATETGLTTPLRWEVSTGWRRIFELYSMDVAGETFKRAFDIRDEDDGEESKSKSRKAPGTAKGNGSELYQPEVPEESGSSRLLTAEEKAADNLNAAIATAKVVCFMINVALPLQQGGKTLAESERKKIQRFRSSVRNIYHTLKDRPGLREKSIIVLTQTHLHEGEIERAGGPVVYLANIRGGDGAELCNLARKYEIPVIAVSAINEERDSNELPPISSPDDIHSSGLFGFLLLTAGRVAKSDPLADVMAAYCKYQRRRVEYLRFPALGIKSRLPLSRKYREAADEYVKACERYLDTPGNFAETPGDASLSMDDLRLYRQRSREDKEISSATGREYLVRDEQWDMALRKAVSKWYQSGDEPEPEAVYGEVLHGMTAELFGAGGGAATEEFVYGFAEDEFFHEGEPSSFKKWIAVNLAEYRNDLQRDVDELPGLHADTQAAVDELAGAEGTRNFDACLESAEKKYQALRAKIELFNEKWKWMENPGLREAMSRLESIATRIDRAKANHGDALAKKESERREEEIEQGLCALRTAVDGEIESIDNMAKSIGMQDFDRRMADVVYKHKRIGKDIVSKSGKWRDEYGLEVSGLSGIESDWKSLWEKICENRRRHASVIRRKGIRKKILAALLAAMSVSAFAATCRMYCLSRNRAAFESIKALYERGNPRGAAAVYGKMYELPFLGVNRDEYFAPGLAERLSAVSDVKSARTRVKALEQELSKLEAGEDFRKFARPQQLVDSVGNVYRQVRECTKEVDAISFEAVGSGSVRLDSIKRKLEECEGNIKSLLQNATLACKDARLGELCERAEKRLDEITEDNLAKITKGKFADADKDLIEVRDLIEKAPPYEACSDTIKNRLENVKSRYAELDNRLTSAKNAVSAMKAASDARAGSLPRLPAKWAKDKWKKAEELMGSATNKLGKSDFSVATDLFAKAKDAYEKAGSIAAENAAPRVKIVAKFEDVEKIATIKASVLTEDALWEGLLDEEKSGAVIHFDAAEDIGRKIRFEAEYEENNTKYIGSVDYTVEEGLHELEINLEYRDTLKPERRGCGHCGDSLEKHPHVYRCPKCLREIKKDAFQ